MFPALVEASKKGNTKQLRQLLQQGVPVLPFSATTEPLVEAIRHNQRDAVFLLLSAGAPLCNRSIEDITALEASYNTIPAIFSALIRKVIQA